MTEKTLIKNKDELVKKAKHPQRPQQSIAMEILHDFKVENTTLKVLLGISILANILIAVILK